MIKCGCFVVTTNTINTVESNHSVAGLCSSRRGGALIAAPLGEVHVGQEDDTAFETYVSSEDVIMFVASSCTGPGVISHTQWDLWLLLASPAISPTRVGI